MDIPRGTSPPAKLLKVVARVDSRTIPVASIREDMTVTWLLDDIPPEPVKVAWSQFISDVAEGCALDPIEIGDFSVDGRDGNSRTSGPCNDFETVTPPSVYQHLPQIRTIAVNTANRCFPLHVVAQNLPEHTEQNSFSGLLG